MCYFKGDSSMKKFRNRTKPFEKIKPSWQYDTGRSKKLSK